MIMNNSSSTADILYKLHGIKDDIDSMLCSSQLNQWDDVARHFGQVEEKLANMSPELIQGYEEEFRYIHANLLPIMNVTKVHQDMIAGRLCDLQKSKKTVDRYLNLNQAVDGYYK